MEKFKKILINILFPPVFVIVILVPASTVLLIHVFTNLSESSVIAYVSYVISAYTLTVACCRIPAIIKSIKQILHSKRYLSDKELRARISLQLGLLLNIIYSVFKLTAGVYYSSFWFGAEAVYYIILSASRYALIKKERKKSVNPADEWRTYKLCGYLMLLLNLAMSVIVVQIVYQNKSYSYAGFIIYATAAYTFYRLTMAIIHVIKFNPRKYSLLSASKLLNLSAALISLFALQSAMLTQFGEGNADFTQKINAATGSAVCTIAISTALFMIINSRKKLKAFNKTQT